MEVQPRRSRGEDRIFAFGDAHAAALATDSTTAAPPLRHIDREAVHQRIGGPVVETGSKHADGGNSVGPPRCMP